MNRLAVVPSSNLMWIFTHSPAAAAASAKRMAARSAALPRRNIIAFSNRSEATRQPPSAGIMEMVCNEPSLI